MEITGARVVGINQPSSSSDGSAVSDADSATKSKPAAQVDAAIVDAYFRNMSAHALRACATSGHDPKLVVLVLSTFGDGADKAAKVRRFALHDHEGMAAAAAALAREDGRNVYMGLSLMRATLSGQQRGGLDDVVGVVGLAADIDGDKGATFDLDEFGLPPTTVVVTSRFPARNWQPAWWFTRVVKPDEAMIMAWALTRVVRDKDRSTADIAHVWRPPGTLNWPKPAKIKRGRPETPQEVELLDGEIGQPVNPARFLRALEEALGVTDLRAAYEAALPKTAASGPQEARQSTPSPEEPRVYSKNDTVADQWGGTEHEKRRVAVTLEHVKADCSMIDWLKTGHGLFTYAGSSWGREAWDAWAGGGSFCGVTYSGSSKFDAMAQSTAWANFAKRDSDEAKASRGAKIGTVFWLAKVHGGKAYFDAIKPFGKQPKAKLQHSEDVQSVLAAGASIPTGKFRLMARIAHSKHLLLTSKSIMLCRMLSVVTDYLNRERHVGWAGYHRLANNMSYAEPCSVENVQKLMRELEALGYIKTADGRGLNVVGTKGPTYTLTPPQSFTWESLIAWNRDMVGHDEQTAWDFSGLSDNPGNPPVGNQIDNLVNPPPPRQTTPTTLPPTTRSQGCQSSYPSVGDQIHLLIE